MPTRSVTGPRNLASSTFRKQTSTNILNRPQRLKFAASFSVKMAIKSRLERFKALAKSDLDKLPDRKENAQGGVAVSADSGSNTTATPAQAPLEKSPVAEKPSEETFSQKEPSTNMAPEKQSSNPKMNVAESVADPSEPEKPSSTPELEDKKSKSFDLPYRPRQSLDAVGADGTQGAAAGPVRGSLADVKTNFVPIMPLSKYPYKFAYNTDGDKIAKRFFDQGKFWMRTWEL